MAFGKSIKIYRASIVIITILAFFIGITVESWHSHEHSREQVSQTSHNDEKSPTNSDKDECPLCNVHLTKDIVITDIHTVQDNVIVKKHNNFSLPIPYTQPQLLYSARGPPVL